MEDAEKESIKEAVVEVSYEFKNLIDSENLESLKQLQHLMYSLSLSSPLIFLGRLQDSSAVLSHFNDYSEHCFNEVSGDFARNTRLLQSMKSDLDYIFQKLRSMKAKLLATYPDAFADDSKGEILDRRPDLELSQ